MNNNYRSFVCGIKGKHLSDKEKNMPTTKVSKETLTELKKQIVTFEKENNTRDVVGRRLWNYLKANNGEQTTN